MTTTRREIADHFRAAIDSGQYTAGDVLPRSTDVATQWSVSKDLVQGAYGDLQREGLVRTIRSRGTVVQDRGKQQLPISRLVRRDGRGYHLDDGFGAASIVLRATTIDRVPTSELVARLLRIAHGSHVVIRRELRGVEPEV